MRAEVYFFPAGFQQVDQLEAPTLTVSVRRGNIAVVRATDEQGVLLWVNTYTHVAVVRFRP